MERICRFFRGFSQGTSRVRSTLAHHAAERMPNGYRTETPYLSRGRERRTALAWTRSLRGHHVGTHATDPLGTQMRIVETTS